MIGFALAFLLAARPGGTMLQQLRKPARLEIARAAASATLLLGFAGVASAQAIHANQGTERRIVVSIPDRKLALVEDGRVVKVYPIAVGAPSDPSPTGQFKIINRLTDPAYYAPGIVIPPGKNNPLGTRWMGLSRKRFGIHGTNEPKSIGHDASHGCIRMRNRDAEELFERVRVGDTVAVMGERSVELAALFGTPVAPTAPPAAKPAAPVAPVAVAIVAVP
jgi:lipoprotein-anchoring transpeptidase ErfK/SrfK